MSTKNKEQGAKGAVPDHPKKPVSGYIKHQMDVFKKFKGDSELRDKAKVLWEGLTDAGRKKYDDAYQKEHEEYKVQKNIYEKKYGKIEIKPKNKAQDEDVNNHVDKPDHPKKPVSGYLKFRIDTLAKNKGVSGMNEQIKGMWEDLADDEKKEYNDHFQDQMEDYRAEKAEYEEKYGKIEIKRKQSKTKEISRPEKEKGGKKVEEKPKVAEKKDNKKNNTEGQKKRDDTKPKGKPAK